MITINLLPEEYRSRIRPSIKLFAAGYSSLTVAASLLAWWAWLVFAVSTTLETQGASLETEMAGLTPQVDYNQTLRREAAFHASREDILAKITTSAITYWLKCPHNRIEQMIAKMSTPPPMIGGAPV